MYTSNEGICATKYPYTLKYNDNNNTLSALRGYCWLLAILNRHIGHTREYICVKCVSYIAFITFTWKLSLYTCALDCDCFGLEFSSVFFSHPHSRGSQNILRHFYSLKSHKPAIVMREITEYNLLAIEIGHILNWSPYAYWVAVLYVPQTLDDADGCGEVRVKYIDDNLCDSYWRS